MIDASKSKIFRSRKKKKHFPLEKEEKRDTKGRKRSLRDSFLEPTYSWAAEWRDQESFFRGGKTRRVRAGFAVAAASIKGLIIRSQHGSRCYPEIGPGFRRRRG